MALFILVWQAVPNMKLKKITNPWDTFIGDITPPSVGYCCKCREGSQFPFPNTALSTLAFFFFFNEQASCSHTLAIPHTQPHRQTRLAESNRNVLQQYFYLTHPIKSGAAHTNAPSLQWNPATKLSRTRWAGGVLMASAVTHRLPECVRVPDVPLAFPVEHSPRTHWTSLLAGLHLSNTLSPQHTQ